MKQNFTNRFTGEKLSTYPTAFASLSKKILAKKDAEKLEKQREKFSSRYICPICKQPKTWIEDTNIMVCTNESCTGIPVKNRDGEVFKYLPSYSQLTHRGCDIAKDLYGEKEN